MTPLQFANHMLAKAAQRPPTRQRRGGGGGLIALAFFVLLVLWLLAIAHASGAMLSESEAPPPHVPAWTWL